jgi:Protein of unknown function (DUF1566)
VPRDLIVRKPKRSEIWSVRWPGPRRAAPTAPAARAGSARAEARHRRQQQRSPLSCLHLFLFQFAAILDQMVPQSGPRVWRLGWAPLPFHDAQCIDKESIRELIVNMSSRLRVVLWVLPLMFQVGCGGGSSAAKCVPGASAECACLGQQGGVQVCTSSGTYGTCVCVAMPAPDASGSDSVASWLDAAALGGSDGSVEPVADAAVGPGAASLPDAPALGGSGGPGGATASTGGTGDSGVENAGDARVADAPGGQSDVPMGGTGGTVATGGTLDTGSSGGIVDTSATTSDGETTCTSSLSCPIEPIYLVCERSPTAVCLDPNWNEWPLPNSQVDVSAGAPNLEAYTDNGDGTVTDNVTGLMWQQQTPASAETWVIAVGYCLQVLDLAGHNDWRLPSIIELMSIVDTGHANPSINSKYFPSTPSERFWSSSLLAGSESQAWVIYFGAGGMARMDVTAAFYVRCVR